MPTVNRDLAQRLAAELRLLADACDILGDGSDPEKCERARSLLEGSIDNHWRGIVVGERRAEALLNDYHEEEQDVDTLQEVM